MSRTHGLPTAPALICRRSLVVAQVESQSVGPRRTFRADSRNHPLCVVLYYPVGSNSATYSTFINSGQTTGMRVTVTSAGLAAIGDKRAYILIP
jgi:hypothetical protein